MAKLTFYGAARQVTGSMHILEANGKLILLDCGLFQGRRADTRKLNEFHPRHPSTIHAVVVSHAHTDHTGRIPMLVRDGFTGVIHATPATRDLMAVMLPDAAHIQAEDARWLNKRRKSKDEPEIEPLFNADHAVQSVRQIQASPYTRWFKVASGIHARFHDAGHMLGSAGIEIEITENGMKRTLFFTGDVGRWGTPILRDPTPLPACDDLICECTYGGRTTAPVTEMKSILADVVRRTVDRGGRILVPAFAVGRTQSIVYYLRQLFVEGTLPRLPVYIDSPLAVNATEIFRLHPECYDQDAIGFSAESNGLLDGPEIHYVRTADESKRVTRRRSPCIVIAGSGMCEAGRILHHLRNGIGQSKNTIVIVGFQAAHTLGRRLVERQEHVNIYGEKHKLNAEVVVLNGFSSHADSNELKTYLAPRLSAIKNLYLVHGEIDQALAFASVLHEAGRETVHIPASDECFDLK